jgi:hypothetical protein
MSSLTSPRQVVITLQDPSCPPACVLRSRPLSHQWLDTLKIKNPHILYLDMAIVRI